MITGKKHTEIGSLMEVMRQTTIQFGKKISRTVPRAKHKQSSDLEETSSNFIEEQDDHSHSQVAHSSCISNGDNIIGPEEDEDNLAEPYCKGVYILQTGSIDIVFRETV